MDGPQEQSEEKVDVELGVKQQSSISVDSTGTTASTSSEDGNAGNITERRPSKVREKIRASIRELEDGGVGGNHQNSSSSVAAPPRKNSKSERNSSRRNFARQNPGSGVPPSRGSSNSVASSSSGSNRSVRWASLRREKWESSYGTSVGRSSSRLVYVDSSNNENDQGDVAGGGGKDNDDTDKATAIAISSILPGAVAVREPAEGIYDDPTRRRQTPMDPHLCLSSPREEAEDDEVPVIRATAVPITEEDDESSPKAYRSPFRDRRVLICILIAVIVIASLVVALVVALGSGDSGGSANVGQEGRDYSNRESPSTNTHNTEKKNSTSPSSTFSPTSGSPTATLTPTNNDAPTSTSLPLTARSLRTAMDGTFSRPALLFDLTAKSDLFLTGLSLLVKSSTADEIDLSLWTKEGSYVGSDSIEQAWTPMHHATPIHVQQSSTETVGAGYYLVRLPEEEWGDPIGMSAGTRRAFYLKLDKSRGKEGLVSSVTNDDVGSVFAEDENLAVLVGASKAGGPSFGNTPIGRRGWNGVVHYKVQQ